jgi:hypothetical protein
MVMSVVLMIQWCRPLMCLWARRTYEMAILLLLSFHRQPELASDSMGSQ